MSTPYCWTVNSFGEVWTLYQQGGGKLMSPAGQDFAQDIVYGAGILVWIISTEDQKGGALIKGSEPPFDGTWFTIPAPAAASRIDTAPNGDLWTVNDMGEVWVIHPQGGGYLASPPGLDFALDIGCGDDGSVWITSMDVYPDYGNMLKRYDPSSKTWNALPAPASAIKVAVGPNGVLYTVNSKGEVWLVYPQGGGALLSPPNKDFAQDISVGPDGTVWIISNQGRPGGDAVMWWSGANQIWNTIPAPAAAIAVSGAVQ
jgi:hypothetical protein